MLTCRYILVPNAVLFSQVVINYTIVQESPYQEKVFGLFEKLDPNSEGTGLGLALVKRIVERYRGAVWLESAGLGQGVCVWFTLPGAIEEPVIKLGKSPALPG